jgi:hypothetical protein
MESNKGRIETWDVASPYFERAVRDGDETAIKAIHNTVESALEGLSGRFGYVGSVTDDYDLEQLIVDAIVEEISSRDAAENDEATAAEEAEEEEENEWHAALEEFEADEAYAAVAKKCKEAALAN